MIVIMKYILKVDFYPFILILDGEFEFYSRKYRLHGHVEGVNEARRFTMATHITVRVLWCGDDANVT